MKRAADNRQRGFILLPVVIAFTLIAVIALLLNRDSGMNLSRAARGLQADDARYVAEAGLAQASYRAQNSDCVNYPALTNVAFGTDSFTASATPTSGSPVTLSATATTATGAKATLTRSGVAVYYTTPRTATLQPATLLQDTYLNADETSKNYGASTTLKLDDGKKYPMLRFDLSSIPAASIVRSAQLMLYKSGGGGGPPGSLLTVYPLTRAWVEGTLNGSSPADGATWNTANGITAWTTPGGDYDSSLVSTTISTGSNDTWLSWDVTNTVKNWVAGASPNYGFIVKPSAGVPSQTYVSGDDTSQRANTPKLVITYLPRCDWTPPPSVVTLPAAADAYIDGNNQFLNYGITTSLPMAEQTKQRVVVRFDTSAFAPGTLLGSAKLRYYVSGISNRTGSTMNLEAHALTRAWAEGIMNGGPLGDVSWKNATLLVQWATSGGDYAGANAATLALPSTFNSGWIEFDITALAQAWVDGVQANYGVILLEKTNDVLALNSREAASNPPQLVLTW